MSQIRTHHPETIIPCPEVCLFATLLIPCLAAPMFTCLMTIQPETYPFYRGRASQR